MTTDTLFTTAQIREKLQNWTLEPLTQTELDHVNRSLTILDEYGDGIFRYGQNDIESLILELLPEDEAEDDETETNWEFPGAAALG